MWAKIRQHQIALWADMAVLDCVEQVDVNLELVETTLGLVFIHGSWRFTYT